ncbi:type II toxin-antitoxin system RelE/ParE family toxin [Proteiniphilum sp. UBA7639]|jgi:phage-related protein|uniref:type II toxin-antitoxin system RelE/ParE family toxin n=1 Tax=Proteiniphilum sp. UBA7639 TaxID=1947289 RepID=UPI00257D36C8|nr:type II toxin-antitoxin system RelE/ParE family toxin [Proteiniphilum sp. UBA7639]
MGVYKREMYQIIFYHTRNGESEILDYLHELKIKAVNSKTARINRKKILDYINALSVYGTRIGQPFVRYIGKDLWELRPLRNRIIFFYWRNNSFVLLHYFIKKTSKTPLKEINQAHSELKDFLERVDSK